jgi:hypothetical protein
MLGKLARAITVLFFVTMIAVYALSVAKTETAAPQDDQQVYYVFT